MGAGSFSALALGLVSAAILSRYFSKTEYGTYRQILYVYNTLLIIFTAGLPRVFSYYLPRYTLSQGKEIVWKISKIMLLCGLAFSGFLFAFSGILADVLKNPELSVGLKVFAPVPLLLLPTLGIEGIFSTYQKTFFIAIYNILTRVITLLFVVLPVVLFKGTYLYAIYGWIISSLITLVIAYFFKNIPFKGTLAERTGLTIKEILKYSLPIAFASVAGIIDSTAIQFYISRYFGVEVFAEFSNGFVQIPFVSMITGATATVLMPLFSKIVHEKSNIDELTGLWRNALQKSVILIYPMVIFCMFYSREIMVILFSDAYSVSAKYFSIAMIVNFFNVVMFTPLWLSLGKSRFFAGLQFGNAFLTWFLGYFIVMIFQTPIAIAIMSVIISICYFIIAFIYTSKTLDVSINKLFPLIRVLIITLHSAISILLIKTLSILFMKEMSDLMLVALAGCGYVIFLMATSKWFDIDYLKIIAPLINRNSDNKFIVD